MKFEIVPAYEISLGEQAKIANEAFAGYVGGWTDLDAATLARFLCAQGADLYHSRFVRSSAGLVGFGYINRTGRILRLNGMAVIPAARGSGAADFLVDHLIDEARERADEAMMLEVIEQNPRAHALYQRHGFTDVDHLLSWRRAADLPPPEMPAVQLEEIAIAGAVGTPSSRDYPQLPWQISRHAVAKLSVARAFQAASACVIVGDVAAAAVRVHAFFSGSDEARWPQLRAALAAIISRFGQREFIASAIFPADFGEHLFAPLGFTREPLSQSLMRREISA